MPKLQKKLQTAQVLGFSDGIRDNRAGVLQFLSLSGGHSAGNKSSCRKLQTLSLLKDLLMSFL
jgi:hypothetical protein